MTVMGRAMRISGGLISAGALAFLLAGCGGSKRTIRIPESVVPDPSKPNAKSRSAIQPYVIKMSDGRRTWQIEIPVSQGSAGFQAMVPLSLGDGAVAPPGIPETEADREIRGAEPETAKTEEAPGKIAAKDGAKPAQAAEAPASGRSYLATLARVNALFRKRQYELALIDLVALEREYPDDERVLEMKGTLYWKLKKPKLAKESWDRVLALNPDNVAVAQALEHLLGE